MSMQVKKAIKHYGNTTELELRQQYSDILSDPTDPYYVDTVDAGSFEVWIVQEVKHSTIELSNNY